MKSETGQHVTTVETGYSKAVARCNCGWQYTVELGGAERASSAQALARARFAAYTHRMAA